MKTGFLGLGAMGRPMALNLHRAGLLAAVWNRTTDKAAELADATGCRRARDPSDLAAGCDAIVLCVSRDADVLEMVDSMLPGLSAGAVVIDCSTVSATTARRASASLADVGAGFLDCPVSGGTEGAATGSLSIMVGGAAVDLERVRPILEAMGKSVIHLGPTGAGQAAKATNQIMVAGINQAVTEALAFARAHQLPMDRLIPALESGAAGNWFLSHRGATMVRGEYPLGFKVELHHKDLEICAAMATSFEVRLPLVEMTLLHYRRLLEQHDPEEDISSLFRLKAALFDAGED
jgi:3-hydroxyisobutyrate dehydrogenase